MNVIRIATRNSPLALWQANFVKDQLRQAHDNLAVEIVGMTTRGDQLLDRSLSKVGGKGLFLKELEVSLLNNETDIAVHSMKDVPVHMPAGLTIPVVCAREDARDAFVSNDFQNLYALPIGARVGTSSLRRVAQLKSAFPKLEFVELRGNVNTRLAKLDEGKYDAIILAAAGLIRLGFIDRIKQYITPELCLPAVGQGIVGIECRSDDKETQKLIEALHNPESALVLAAERAMNAALEGGCQVPIAGYAEINKGRIHMRGVVGEPNGMLVLQAEAVSEHITNLDAAKLGQSLAEDLLKQGAGDILSSVKSKANEVKPLVLLTRQERHLGNMATILQRLDYQAVHIPTIEIEPNYDPDFSIVFGRLSDYTDVLFVSRSAVEVGMAMIEEQGGIPDGVRVMAMGAETAKQLYRYGVDALFPSTGTGAKALLKVKQLVDLTGRSILIVRGDVGLDWPAEEMRSRGASVDEAHCYKQSMPENSAGKLQNELQQGAPLACVFAHSSYSLSNLMQMAGENIDTVSQSTLVAGSRNIAAAAKESGWQGEIVVAESPANKHMMIAFSG